MFPRRAAFGMLTVLVLTGAAHARPPEPGGPLSEGRELDPVARDTYRPVPTGEPGRDRAPAPTAEKPGDTVGGFVAVLDTVIRLGMVRPAGGR